MMKTIHNIKYLYLLTVLLLVSSCSELDLNPESSYVQENFYTTTENAQAVVNGAYAVLTTTGAYGLNCSAVYPFDNDIATYGTNAINTNLSGARESLVKYASDNTSPSLKATWQTYYSGISKANSAIEGISAMELLKTGTEEEKKELNRSLGEALFLRGLLHFDLVKLFGEVPLVVKSFNIGDETLLRRNSYKTLYNQIIEDMSNASELVPWYTEVGISERPTKGAILGILGRASLHAAGYMLSKDEGAVKRLDNYADYYLTAVKALDKVIASGVHGLNTSGEFGFDEVFNNYHKFNLEPMESMFEIPFYSADGLTGGPVGQNIGVKQHPRSIYGKATGTILQAPNFYQSFENDDPRRDFSIANFEILKPGTERAYIFRRQPNVSLFTCGKWERRKISLFGTSGANSGLNYTNMNYVMLRYSDVLLMFAEAYHESEKAGVLPGLTSGLNQYSALNKVRNRIGLTPISSGNVSAKASESDLAYGDNPDDFSIVLRQERAWELCFEGLRKYDLNRWNSLSVGLNNTGVNSVGLNYHPNKWKWWATVSFVPNQDELYQIPISETSINPNLLLPVED